jgi:hypothetical protein
MVYESTAECFVTGNALAGAIPTEIGQLAQLQYLYLNENQLTGASTNSLDCNFGIRVYQHLKKTFLLCRQHSHGIRPLHVTDGALPVQQPIDR